MLATLIHSTSVSDSQSERDENKKPHTNLVKKLRKELADKNSATVKLVRQLLPLAKSSCSNSCEVIACEPVGSLLDTKVVFMKSINLKKFLIINFNHFRGYA
jgi:mediator of RNA polymerase II transcription subunit 12